MLYIIYYYIYVKKKFYFLKNHRKIKYIYFAMYRTTFHPFRRIETIINCPFNKKTTHQVETRPCK